MLNIKHVNVPSDDDDDDDPQVAHCCYGYHFTILFDSVREVKIGALSNL